jgi:hypothetical protein
METFDAAEFREHINSLIPHLLPAIKDSELEKKIGE